MAASRASGRFDFAWYRETFGGGARPIEDYLLRESHLLVAPNRTFDRAFFLAHYPRTIRERERPFVAFCRLADHHAWCRDSAAAFEADAALVASSQLFDEAAFREDCGDLDEAADAATYYLTEGARRALDPSRDFSTRGYLTLYPDIAKANLNSLVHYLRHGQAEGRHRLGADQLRRREGPAGLRRGLATILVVCHEGSLSGAPVVGLNLARCLAASYNVVSVLLRDGPLAKAFATVSQEVVVIGDHIAHMNNALEVLTNEYDFACAVLNSVECTKMLPKLIEMGVPAVSLIHEFAQYV